MTDDLLAGVLEEPDEGIDENKYSVLDLFRYKNLRCKTWWVLFFKVASPKEWILSSINI